MKKYLDFINESKYDNTLELYPEKADLIIKLKEENITPAWLPWVVKNCNNMEDIEIVIDFNIAKQNNLIQKADIFSYNTIQKIKDEIENVKGRIKRIKDREGIKPIFESGPYEIYKLNNYNECAKLLNGTDFCIKKPDRFDFYTIDNTDPEKTSKLGAHELYIVINEDEKGRFNKIVIGKTKFITIIYDVEDEFLNNVNQIITLELPESRAVWKKWTINKCLKQIIYFDDIKNYFMSMPNNVVSFLNRTIYNPTDENPNKTSFKASFDGIINGHPITFDDYKVVKTTTSNSGGAKLIISNGKLIFYANYDNEHNLVKINKDANQTEKIIDINNPELIEYFTNICK